MDFIYKCVQYFNFGGILISGKGGGVLPSKCNIVLGLSWKQGIGNTGLETVDAVSVVVSFLTEFISKKGKV